MAYFASNKNYDFPLFYKRYMSYDDLGPIPETIRSLC